MKRSSWIRVSVVLFLAIIAVVWIVSHNMRPLDTESLARPRVYAYKDWQSVGLQVNPGDRIDIRAEGQWLYTPGEYHGPEGHRHYLAPDTYPINATAGGILLGRIGENGQLFIVGKGRTIFASESGMLYFRINDDILSDNEGYVHLELTVTTEDLDE